MIRHLRRQLASASCPEFVYLEFCDLRDLMRAADANMNDINFASQRDQMVERHI